MQVSNPLILAPDLQSYGMWQKSGAPQLYGHMTDFIARSVTGVDFTGDFDFKDSFVATTGYAPMIGKDYKKISPLGIQQLTQQYPFFFIFIYMIPFYYLTSKIASEKESKAREGMKMMGLEDGTYYLSYFILFMAISLVNSGFIALITGIKIFTNVNMTLFFIMCMLYSLTLFGTSFVIVAFLPTKRTSGIAASLWHLMTYFLSSLL